MRKLYSEFIRYGAVGATSLVVDFSSYLLFTRWLGLAPAVSNVLAYALGNFVSFTGHRLWTFHSSGRPVVEYSRFLIVTVVGLTISQTVLLVALAVGTGDIVAKAAAVALSGLFNFISNRLWTFKERA